MKPKLNKKVSYFSYFFNSYDYHTVLPLMSARGAHFFKGLREGALIRGRRSFEGGAHSFDDQMVKFITKYIRIFTLVSFENYNFQDIRPTKIFELA